MRHFITAFALILTFCIVAPSVSAAEEGDYDTYTLWVGGHYTEFDEYAKKVGEYNLGENEGWPEFRFDLLSRRGNSLFSLNGHFYDDKNIYGLARITAGTRFSGKFRYRSLIHQKGQDLLANMAAREWLGGVDIVTGDEIGAGKMLTHTVLDPGADYNIHRQEALSEINLLLSKKYDVEFVAAHRMILQEGTDQSLSNSHCFSCHVESRTRRVNNITHSVETGLQATPADNMTLGYMFGYRQFKSEAPDPFAPYDDAKHPVDINNAGTEAEFDSRLTYEDTTIAVNTMPETEKMSHKVRFKGNLGKGRFSSAVAFARTENQTTELKKDAYSGSINYAYPVGRKTRLLTKLSGIRLTADDPFIDLPLYRAGRPGPDGVVANVDFDYTRYSVIDRFDLRFNAEIVHRLTPRWTVAVLGGYEMISRDDYPTIDDGLNTKRFIGQVKANYRKGLSYSSRVKYRFEKTSDPFVSGRGLFEYSGADSLNPLAPGFSFIFYFQREDIRYQSITTEPTDYHEFEWSSNWKPLNKVSLTLGARGYYDKNNDLDSLDVEHFSIVPNVNLNVMPTPTWVATAGYTFNHYKSRGPVTVALFDG